MSTQAVRAQFRFFQNVPRGSLNPPDPIERTSQRFGFAATTAYIWCPGLDHKTVEILAVDVDLVNRPVVIQASITGAGNQSDDWTSITGNITAQGIYPILVAAASSVPFMAEPEVTILRIIATDAGNGNFPQSIRAVFSGVWHGDDDCFKPRCVTTFR